MTEGAPDCGVFGESGNVVSESAVWVYQSIYIIVPLVLLFFSNTCRRLRRMEVMVYGCFGLGLFLFLMIPFSCPLKEFQPETLAGHACCWTAGNCLTVAWLFLPFTCCGP